MATVMSSKICKSTVFEMARNLEVWVLSWIGNCCSGEPLLVGAQVRLKSLYEPVIHCSLLFPHPDGSVFRPIMGGVNRLQTLLNDMPLRQAM